VALAAAALVFAPSALAVPTPTGLHGFLLTAGEAEQPTRTFARTPAFAWDSVPGAERYEFELSTSKTFADNAIVWSDDSIEGPITTVSLTLPWISGARYSWYARVRAVVEGEEGPWSKPWGFNMRAPGAPRSLSNGTNPNPGMVRWTPVDGATGYEVVFLFDLASGSSKKIKTATTAADLREYYAFHNTFPSSVYWRVRAVREIQGAPKNKMPVVSYGPWSARNRTVEPTLGATAVDLQGAVSRARLADVQGTTAYPGAHELVPGFWWSGSRSLTPELLGACPQVIEDLIGAAGCPLFHVYVFSDADCVNRVHVSDLVGSPAYVPRQTGPLALPGDKKKLVEAPYLYLNDSDKEGLVYDAGGEPVTPSGIATEEGTGSAPADPAEEGSGEEPAEEESSSSGSATAAIEQRTNGLWDNDWPTSRYYWVVVPAVPYVTPDDKVEYHDVAFAEDMCAAGEVMTFGKTSVPVAATSNSVPYASGLSSTGQLVHATTVNPAFYGKPVIAWTPAPGATRYEVQWSKTEYPWRKAGKLVTPATSALLELPVGKWYYRIRGLDRTLPGSQGLTWTDPIAIQIMPRTFDVVSKTSIRKGRR
jgi:hypothetical protein